MFDLIEAFPWLGICHDDNTDLNTQQTTEIPVALKSDLEQSGSGSSFNTGSDDEDDFSDQSDEVDPIRSGAVAMAADYLAREIQKRAQTSPSSTDTESDEDYKSTCSGQSQFSSEQRSLTPYALISELCKQSERTVRLRQAELLTIYKHGDWQIQHLVARSHASILPEDDDFDTRHTPLDVAPELKAMLRVSEAYQVILPRQQSIHEMISSMAQTETTYEKWNRLGLVEEGLHTFFLLLVFFGVYRLATISTDT